MKNSLIAVGFVFGLTSLLAASGCFDSTEDCASNPGNQCGPFAAAGGGGQSGSGGQGGEVGGGGGAGGAGGVGGGGGDNCEPSLGPVHSACGLFVSAELGAVGAAGSKEAPLKSLQTAIDLAVDQKRVYACAEVFSEALTVTLGGLTLYGGLDCANDWQLLADTKTTVSAPEKEQALHVASGGAGLSVSDIAFEAKDASLPGSSSVAVWVEDASATFERCEMRAGDGGIGVDGADAPAASPVQPAMGQSGADACTNNVQVPGAPPTANDCGGGDISIGGGGGAGNNLNGSNGSDGQPASLAGSGGQGQPASGVWVCGLGSGKGHAGSDGAAGTAGMGAVQPGKLTSFGYVGSGGVPGNKGDVAQGGGGGGGARSPDCDANQAGVQGAGASGGAGGAGGCGGLAGDGGGPGGASFALVSMNASVTLSDCVLKSASGGGGGAGGDYQPGGPGGLAGAGGVSAGSGGCVGGAGGTGGDGGPGGGGLGGPSAAIAHVGGAPVQLGATTLSFGAAGLGGPGGSGDAQVNGGAKGISAAILSY